MNILGARKIWLTISAVLVAVSIAAMAVYGFRPGIDFAGGTLLEVRIDNVDQSKLPAGTSIESIKTVLPQVTELRFESVSPTLGGEVVRKAVLAVIVAMLAILLYLAYAFRRVPKPTSSWQFGAAAVIALLAHDVIILLGVYSVMGHFWGAEADSMFITALLTLLGFSVHDTIVTFERLRENLLKRGPSDFEKKMNDSIVETVTRSK